MSQTQNHPTVRPDTARSMLARAELSIPAAARELGLTREYFWRMLTGRWPVSRRLERDLPLLLSEKIGLDPDAIRSAIFTSGDPVDHAGEGSFLDSRIHTKGAAHVKA